LVRGAEKPTLQGDSVGGFYSGILEPGTHSGSNGASIFSILDSNSVRLEVYGSFAQFNRGQAHDGQGDEKCDSNDPFSCAHLTICDNRLTAVTVYQPLQLIM
jgi:hypothetical protein